MRRLRDVTALEGGAAIVGPRVRSAHVGAHRAGPYVACRRGETHGTVSLRCLGMRRPGPAAPTNTMRLRAPEYIISKPPPVGPSAELTQSLPRMKVPT